MKYKKYQVNQIPKDSTDFNEAEEKVDELVSVKQQGGLWKEQLTLNPYINEYGNRIESKYYISPALRLDLNATEYELYRGMNKNVLRDSSLVFTVKCKPVSPGEAN